MLPRQDSPVLVAGGAGYIGSHAARQLRENRTCAERIREVLKWHPQHNDLRLIVESALNWERRLAADSS